MSKTKKTGKSLNSKTDGVLLPPAPGMTRRDFLRGVSGALATTAALGAAMSPAASFIQELSWEEFFQKHYKELSSEEKERVFELFYRCNKSRDNQGNGLGLSLVAAVIKLHKGIIELQDSKPGLKVYIYLPLDIK